MSGRKKDSIWKYYKRTSTNNGNKSTCNKCGKVMQGIVYIIDSITIFNFKFIFDYIIILINNISNLNQINRFF